MEQQKFITWNDVELEVWFDFQPEEKMVWTYSNGDPGHPGSPASFEINAILLTTEDVKGNQVQVDITELFTAHNLLKMEEMLESDDY